MTERTNDTHTKLQRNRNTILAALRFYQDALMAERVPPLIVYIATNCDTHAALSVGEISELCDADASQVYFPEKLYQQLILGDGTADSLQRALDMANALAR
jgi:hypothetical protein